MEKNLDFIGFSTYSILSSGFVKDLRTGRVHNGHFSEGYRLVNLKNPEGSKTYSIHRLVGLAFIDNPENKPEIDHINRDRADNRVENLRWVDDFTQAQNKGVSKSNKLQEKHIHYDQGSYRLVIKKRGVKIVNKRFKTLDEAKKVRDKILTG